MRALIAGWAGTGKSTIAAALQARGLPALDSDEVPGLSAWRNLKTDEVVEIDYGLPIDFERLGWHWSPAVMDKVLVDRPDLFFCGNAGNLWDFVDEFDVFFALTIDEQTQRHRLANRENNIYGKEPSVLEYTLAAQQRFVLRAKQAGAVEIDVTQPIDTVVGEILAAAQEHHHAD